MVALICIARGHSIIMPGILSLGKRKKERKKGGIHKKVKICMEMDVKRTYHVKCIFEIRTGESREQIGTKATVASQIKSYCPTRSG